jgi:cytoskeleton protein RodZ
VIVIESGPSFGTELRRAREADRVTIEQLSKRTRIREDVIRDLEKDDLSSSGGVVYARGHLRTISKILGADSDYLVSLFEAVTQEDQRAISDLLEENNAKSSSTPRFNLSYKKMAGVAAVVVLGIILVPSIASLFHSSQKTHISSSRPAASYGASSTSVVATKSSGVTVVVSGTAGRSWLGVTDASGTQVFNGQIAAGASQVFTNNQELDLVVGNAGAVSLKVNGKDLGTPGAIGEVVHLQFTPNSTSQG